MQLSGLHFSHDLDEVEIPSRLLCRCCWSSSMTGYSCNNFSDWLMRKLRVNARLFSPKSNSRLISGLTYMQVYMVTVVPFYRCMMCMDRHLPVHTMCIEVTDTFKNMHSYASRTYKICHNVDIYKHQRACRTVGVF